MRECFLFSVASELLRLVLCSYEVDSWFTPDIIRSSAMSGFSLRFLRESIFQRLYDNRIGRYLRFSSLVKGKNRPSHTFCQLSLYIILCLICRLGCVSIVWIAFGCLNNHRISDYPKDKMMRQVSALRFR